MRIHISCPAPLLGRREANQPLFTKKGMVQNHGGEQDRGKATLKLLETGLQVKGQGQGQARDTVRDGAFLMGGDAMGFHGVGDSQRIWNTNDCRGVSIWVPKMSVVRMPLHYDFMLIFLQQALYGGEVSVFVPQFSQ